MQCSGDPRRSLRTEDSLSAASSANADSLATGGIPGSRKTVVLGSLIGALFVSLLGWVSPDEPSEQLREHLVGSFVVDEPQTALQMRLGQAVERVVEPLGSPARPIARAQLIRVVDYCRRYRFELEADRLRVKCDDFPALEASLRRGQGVVHRLSGLGADAGARPEAHGGTPVEVELDDDRLELSAEADGNGRTTTYAFADSGRLEVHVRVISDQLDRPLDWTVHYRRLETDDPPTPAVAASLGEAAASSHRLVP